MVSMVFSIKPTTQASFISGLYFFSPFYQVMVVCVVVLVIFFPLLYLGWDIPDKMVYCFVVLIITAMMILSQLGLLWIASAYLDTFITWIGISTEIGNLQEWPTNITCPGHWQDPWASWLWNLI
jgi:hypothetical protein